MGGGGGQGVDDVTRICHRVETGPPYIGTPPNIGVIPNSAQRRDLAGLIVMDGSEKLSTDYADFAD
jgi:hypothetical protein